jgi:beta-galactosidase
VILWSLGNEEMGIQHTEAGIRAMRRMQDLAHRLDPIRPVTYAMNMTWIDICDVHAKAGFRLDVFGANYINDRRPETYDEFHTKHPDWPLCGVENASTWSARGTYVPRTLSDGSPPPPVGQQWLMWANPARKDFVSAYGDLHPQWGGMPEEAWRPVAERPHVAGAFVWTGFDYRGETGPYPWPAVSSNFGILDLCGFPKDIYYYYRAWWSGEPVLHIFPHWNWLGRNGQPIDVWCFSNCAAVELSLNGKSLGRQSMPPNGHLEWRVAYAPGKLEAIGYDAHGAQTLTAVVETTGAPRAIRLTPDRTNLEADGQDLAVIEVAVVDADGRIVPDASPDIHFNVSGPACIIGVGNGDPFSHEPDKADRRRAFCGLCQVLVQTTDAAGDAVLTATSTGLEQGRIVLRAALDDK